MSARVLRRRAPPRGLSLLPELDDVVPAAGDEPGGFDRVPGDVDAGPVVVAVPLAQHARRLEVPDEGAALAVARGEVAAVGREGEAARVARGEVAFELLLAELLGLVARLERDDLVVERLAAEELRRRVQRDDGNRVHLRFRDVLCRDGDVVFPHEHLLVVARRDEAAVVVDEGHRVDGLEVVVVLLHDASGRVGRGVVGRDAEVPLIDPVIRGAREENVVVARIEVDAVAHLAVRRERVRALSRLGVPNAYESVEPRAREGAPVGGKVRVVAALCVAAVRAPRGADGQRGRIGRRGRRRSRRRSYADVPELARAVEARREQEVPRAREEARAAHAARVAREPVHTLLRNERVSFGHLGVRPVFEPARHGEPRPALPVVRLAAVELRRRVDGARVAVVPRRHEVRELALVAPVEVLVLVVAAFGALLARGLHRLGELGPPRLRHRLRLGRLVAAAHVVVVVLASGRHRRPDAVLLLVAQLLFLVVVGGGLAAAALRRRR
mmetsp:Transcript_651/g.2584  ORF Transcript_651/g.2584 Transcript_651/m.2584 type:complete len:499 (+) Transcript_651:196-1692(+)